MNNHPPQSFFDKLQAQAKMRPKWLFVLEHVAVGVAIFLVAIGLVYFGSFLWYLWRSAQFSSLPAVGPEGYRVFAQQFPWWHLGFILLGLVGLFYLLRKGTRIYRWPLAVTIGVFGLAFILAATLADATKIHDALANRELEGRPFPILGQMYHGQRGAIQGLITPGTILSVSKSKLSLQTDTSRVTVRIVKQTQLPDNWNPNAGDRIVVVGEREDDTIEAIAIHLAGELPDRPPFRMHFQFETTPPDPSYY